MALIVQFMTLVTLAFSFSLPSLASELTCPSNKMGKGFYQCRQIVFMTEPSIDEAMECSRGQSFIKVYCENEDQLSEECITGQVLMCRFCKRNNAESKAFLEENANVDPANWDSHCKALEKTKSGTRKVRLSESEFIAAKVNLQQRLTMVIDQLAVFLMINEYYLQNDGADSSIFAEVRKTHQLISGPGGLKESFDRFGSSKTITRLRTTVAETETELWEPLAVRALKLKDEGLEGWNERVRQVISEYSKVLGEVDQFEYKPAE